MIARRRFSWPMVGRPRSWGADSQTPSIGMTDATARHRDDNDSFRCPRTYEQRRTTIDGVPDIARSAEWRLRDVKREEGRLKTQIPGATSSA
jgi:hypothetical protein